MANTSVEKKEKKRIEFLDYLKAVCVLMVIITHYDWTDKSSPVFTMLINMAVPVFMIISGYNFAMSNDKKAEGKLSKMYSWEMLQPKLVRFLVPYFFVCIIEVILRLAFGRKVTLARAFLEGGYGPGSYYVPVMMQLLLIFPIIYVLIAKNARMGIWVVGAANLLFEIAVKVFEIEKHDYRLSVGRYLLLVAFGCYLYLYPKSRIKAYQLGAMFLIGVAYIVAVFEFKCKLPLFRYWKTTAMPIAFYIFPIVVLLFRKFYHSTIPGSIGRILTWIGQASYHIFLTQMVYFHFDFGGSIMQAAWYIAVPFNILVTVPIGLAFYEMDNRVMRQIKQIKQSNREVQ